MSKVKIMVNNTTPTLTTLVPSKTSDLINDSDFQTGTQVATALDGKVDKVPDKGLSTNDYTDAEKTKLEKAIIKRTASGSSATFDDGGDNLPIVSLVATISPFQDGSGDPSPANVRPIRGTDQITFYVNDDDDPLSVSLGRTVYSGTLDVISGVLTVTWGMVDFANHTWGGFNQQANGVYYMISATVDPTVPNHGASAVKMCDSRALTTKSAGQMPANCVKTAWGGFYYTTNQTTLDAALAEIAETPVHIVYELATPITYQLTPHEVNTLLGSNTIYTGSFPVTVTYRADTSIVINNIVNAITSLGGNV